MNGYTIVQLGNDDVFGSYQMQGSNVVWSSGLDGDRKVFFYNGSETIQLTDDDKVNGFPQQDNGKVVWSGTSGSREPEISLYDGNEVTILGNGLSPRIDGDNVVWERWDGNDFEIVLYNGSETIQLTDNNAFDSLKWIDGDNIVYTNSVTSNSSLESLELFFYNGSEAVRLTDNDVQENFPIVKGDNVVWSTGEGEGEELFLYNGSETIQLTNNDVPESSYHIDGNNIVWLSGTGVEAEIFLYDGNETTQLTDNNAIGASFLDVNEGKIVWSNNQPGENFEVFLYDGDRTIQITDNDANDTFPRVDGDNIVWLSESESGTEVWLYDGNETIQLTNSARDKKFLQLDGENVAWLESTSSNSGVEIDTVFLATPEENFTTNSVYRFLNTDTGVHFYTANKAERDAVQSLANFSFEGASYRSVDPITGADNSVPVYRFLNNDTGVHLYTVSEAERDAVQSLANFNFEGEVFFAYETEVNGSIPIYRFFNSNTGAHFYTPSETERDNVENNLLDYESEGIAYYALPADL